MTQSYIFVYSTLALSIHIASLTRELGRLHSSSVDFGSALCIAYALVDIDEQVGVVVDVSSEVYGFIRFIVHPAGSF